MSLALPLHSFKHTLPHPPFSLFPFSLFRSFSLQLSLTPTSLPSLIPRPPPQPLKQFLEQ